MGSWRPSKAAIGRRLRFLYGIRIGEGSKDCKTMSDNDPMSIPVS